MALGRTPGTTEASNAIVLANGETVYARVLTNVTSAGAEIALAPTGNARLLSSAASTNAAVVKASGGSVFKVTGNNTVASKRYLKLYNKATAPTVGTDTPVATIAINASASFDINMVGLTFTTGIGYAITTAAADADTGALGAGDIECLNIEYA